MVDGATSLASKVLQTIMLILVAGAVHGHTEQEPKSQKCNEDKNECDNHCCRRRCNSLFQISKSYLGLRYAAFFCCAFNFAHLAF